MPEPAPPPPTNASRPPAKTAETFDRAYSWRIIAILSVLVIIVMYIEGMLTPSLPAIRSDFGVSVSQVSLVLSVYLVTGVALSPIAGKLGDVYGKKRVMTVILAIYAVAVSTTGFSPTFEFMVASRAVQGVGLTIFPLAMSLVREEFPREMVPKAQGLLSGLFGAGFAVSLPLGAFVSNAYGWRFTYHSAIPFVVAATIACFLFLRESPYRRPNAYVDYAGAGVLAAALALLVLGLSEGPTWGWTSAPELAMLGAGVLLLLPVAVIERISHARGREVILDPKLLGMRNVLVTNIVLTVSGFGMFLAFQALTFRLESPAPTGLALSIFQTGLSFVAFAAPMLVLAPVAGTIVTRVGTKPLTVLGAAIAAGGFALATQAVALEQLLAVMVVIGAGLAVMNSAVINLLILTVEPHDMGIATSMNAVFRNVGSSIGAPVAGSLMATYTIVSYGIAFPDATAFNYAYLIAAASFGVAAVLTLFAREVLGRRAQREVLASDEKDLGELLRARPSASSPAVRSESR